MNDWNLDENHLVSDSSYNIVIYNAQFSFLQKRWQIILGLYLVLVKLNGQFTISIEQDKLKLVTLNMVSPGAGGGD